MWGALATRSPSGSNTAQEKSSRSLMFTEYDVLRSTTPVCSATDMNRLLNTSSITGSDSVPTVASPGRGTIRARIRWLRRVISAIQPGSTTVVAFASMITAGPCILAPGCKPSRSYTRVDRAAPSMYVSTSARLSGAPGSDATSSCGSDTSGAPPTTSTVTASHHVPLLRGDEAVLQLVGLLERRHHGGTVGVVQHQRRVRPLVAQMHFPVDRHA